MDRLSLPVYVSPELERNQQWQVTKPMTILSCVAVVNSDGARTDANVVELAEGPGSSSHRGTPT